MGNTLKGLVENGQPHGLRNKVVTYDGLVDFLEMLKDEIPRMGLNNYIAIQNANNYLFGFQNQSYGYTQFAVGKNNCLGQLNDAFAFGENNNIEGGKSCFIFGNDNNAESVLNAYGFGNNLTLTRDAVWIGQYNDPKENIVFGIGNGNSNEKSNLLTIDNLGGITLLQNAHFNTEVAFKSGINLTDSLTIGPGKTTIIDYFGEVRHVLMPYNRNEGFWLVGNQDDSFHINYRQPDSVGGYTQEQTYQYYVPKEIHFHAGGGQNENNWAKIQCGSLHVHGSLAVDALFSGVRDAALRTVWTCGEQDRYAEVELTPVGYGDTLAAIVIKQTYSETTKIAAGVCFVPDTDETNYLFDSGFVRVTTVKEDGILILRCEPYSFAQGALIPDYWLPGTVFDITFTPLMKLSEQ